MKITRQILFILVAVLALNLFGCAQGSEANPTNDDADAIACTMDAKMCSDGSFVGRIPPNCDFAPCPDEE